MEIKIIYKVLKTAVFGYTKFLILVLMEFLLIRILNFPYTLSYTNY